MLEQKSPDVGFSPLDMIDQALRYWWFMVILILLGGMAGFLAHRVRPPVYEAAGQFTASIDYVATGPLTQYDEDVALNAIGNVISSAQVLDRVVSRAAGEDIQVDRASLRKMAVVERKFTTWDVRVRDTDAGRAKRIAEIWIEEGQALLLESYSHALQAKQLSQYMTSLENCLGESVSSEPSSVYCNPSRLVEIQKELERAGEQFIQERKESYGLFSGLTIGPESIPVLALGPVMYGRNQLVLAGSVIGLLLGIWLFSIGVPARWLKRN
jgi:hypothetical protein